MLKIRQPCQIVIVFLILATVHDNGGAAQTQLNVQQSLMTSENSDQAGRENFSICRPCPCVSAAVPAMVPPQIVMPQALPQQLLQCPPVPACPPPMMMPMPMRPPRPPQPSPAFICPTPQQCPPTPVCPRPEPCPATVPVAPQVSLPAPPALPAFFAPPPPQALRPPPAIVPLIGTQTTCRATGIAATAGRAHGARTASLGSAIWEELFGGGEMAPPPPKLMTMEAKCNSRLLEAAILENMFTDLESSKRRIQATAEQTMGTAVNVVCGASEFSFVVHTDQFCQATRRGMSCYAFSGSSGQHRNK